MGYIPVFTVWKYLVGGIYQRGDLKLKSVKISVQGPFKKKYLLLLVLLYPVILVLDLLLLYHLVGKCVNQNTDIVSFLLRSNT